MLNLIKYEVQRRKNAVFVVVLIITVVQSLIVLGFYKGNSWTALSVILLILLTAGVYLFVLFDGIRTYYRDLNSRQGYMLFLTPNSAYKIIGAKMIVSLAELLFFVLIATGLLVIDYLVLKSVYSEFFSMITQYLKDYIPSAGHVFVLSFSTVLQWLNIITTAVLAITLTVTLLSGSKYSWLVSIVFYLALNTGMQFASMGIVSLFGLMDDFKSLSMYEPAVVFLKNNMSININTIIMKYTLIMGAMYTVYISISYFVSSMLLERRVDLR